MLESIANTRTLVRPVVRSVRTVVLAWWETQETATSRPSSVSAPSDTHTPSARWPSRTTPASTAPATTEEPAPSSQTSATTHAHVRSGGKVRLTSYYSSLVLIRRPEGMVAKGWIKWQTKDGIEARKTEKLSSVWPKVNNQGLNCSRDGRNVN